MAHFAEIDSNNRVLRVVVACNQDIANNGGEQSEQAAEHFKTTCPLSGTGVKWVQTSYNNNFRKKFAGVGGIYDQEKNIFISKKPYDNWVLNTENEWEAPIAYPTITQYGETEDQYYYINWNSSLNTWTGVTQDVNNPTEYVWDASTKSWLQN
jgi:hypothetical protein